MDSVNKTNHAIHWIVIYPVDSVIHLSSNPGQVVKSGNFDFVPRILLSIPFYTKILGPGWFADLQVTVSMLLESDHVEQRNQHNSLEDDKKETSVSICEFRSLKKYNIAVKNNGF